MPIPDYESIMLPLLKLTADGKEHKMAEDRDIIADKEFHLTEEERRVLQPSGVSRVFDNRFGWARTYLTKADLIKVTGRGRYKITQRGLDVIKQNPLVIKRENRKRNPKRAYPENPAHHPLG